MLISIYGIIKLFTLTLTAPPSTNTLRTAFIANGKVQQVKTKDYTRWLSNAKIEALESKWRKLPPPPYDIHIRVGKCNRARDLDNFLKASMDFLVSSKFIEKDSLMMVYKVTSEYAFEIVPDGKITIDIDYYDKN